MPRDLITDGEIHDANAFAANARSYREMPGIVQKYYPPVQGGSVAAVDVKPAVHDVRMCVEDDVPTAGLVEGQRYSEPWPVLYRVPVQFPTFGGFALWGPLKAGDKVMLRAFDLDPSGFLTTGQPQDPPLTRRNGGAHWYAVAGDLTDPGALPDPGGQMCLGTPGGVILAIGPSTVNLGAAAPTDAVALASVLDKILKAFANWTPVANDGGAALKSLLTSAALPVTSASSTVKCKT